MIKPDPKNKWIGYADLGNHVLAIIFVLLLLFITKAAYTTI